MRAIELPVAERAALLQRERALIDASRPFMESLSRAAGADRHAAMLADRGCQVLDVVGDEASVRGPESVPGPGALLAEANAGANGHGTALAEMTYVELVGPEHFIEGFHVFTCQGIPLLGAAGELVGVIGISVRRLETASRVRDVLFCASQGVECELLARWLSEVVVTRELHGRLEERLRQEIVQELASARLRLEAAARRIARGAAASELMAAARELLDTFRARALTWRDLVSDELPAPAPIDLPDLVDSVLGLLEAEARASGIRLRWGRADRAVVVEDRQALARGVLGQALTAMQRAGRDGAVVVDLERASRSATVSITALNTAGAVLGTTSTDCRLRT
ncbi:MAG TPA: GAF domain-containing protein [Anaeromyxobacteraceae bacterium]|nr:GAF domain-containing protein [Anaeromyxobacteraceae bacterium]